MKKKIISMFGARLFVTSMALGITGWICLFGKNLPMSYVPIMYAIIGITIISSIYVYRKKHELLKNRNTKILLTIFFTISAIGWISSISEITGCAPYKCGEDIICATPTELGLRLTTGECTPEFPEKTDYTCTKENDTCTIQSTTSKPTE